MSLHQAEQEFRDFLLSHHHPIDGAINHDSSKFHYCKCPNGTDTDARYKFFNDVIPGGYFKCWHCQIEADFSLKNSLKHHLKNGKLIKKS